MNKIKTKNESIKTVLEVYKEIQETKHPLEGTLPTADAVRLLTLKRKEEEQAMLTGTLMFYLDYVFDNTEIKFCHISDSFTVLSEDEDLYLNIKKEELKEVFILFSWHLFEKCRRSKNRFVSDLIKQLK